MSDIDWRLAVVAASIGLAVPHAMELVYRIATKGDSVEAGCGLLFSVVLLLIAVLVLPHVSVTVH